MLAVQTSLMTPAEYLTFERASETKHEYVAGEIIARAGANRYHCLIQLATLMSLSSDRVARQCEVYMSDMRVKIGALGIYTYPDVVVVCGVAELEDAEQDRLLNPTMIVEISSSSTEAYDRGLKFHRYQLTPSLRDYLLIAQNRPLVEHYTRGDEGWTLARRATAGEQIHLPSIGCVLNLDEIYRQIPFGTAAE